MPQRGQRTVFTEKVCARGPCAELAHTVEGVVSARLWGLLHNEVLSPLFSPEHRRAAANGDKTAALAEDLRTFCVEVLLLDGQYPAVPLKRLPTVPLHVRAERPATRQHEALAVVADLVDTVLKSGGFHVTTWRWHVE